MWTPLSRDGSFARKLDPRRDPVKRRLELRNGARIAVIGGGPAGSLFAHFALKMAQMVELELRVELFEPRSFDCRGPAGCNHCGGIVSESLVQLLATEGVNLPPGVVQRGIDSYRLHMDVGTATIETPLREKRIAAVFRGNGPRECRTRRESFDSHLLRLAESRGARVRQRLVTGLHRGAQGLPVLEHAGELGEAYDLVVVAAGINSNLLRTLERELPEYARPRTVPAYICEFELGHGAVRELLGSSMHVFMLDLPRLEFAALIPKGDVVTLCLLGEGIDAELVQAFLAAPEVRRCFPAAASLPRAVCNCAPLLNVRGPPRPWADRLVFIGDAGVTRLYKDGIGAAYRTAKAAAATAVFQGVSTEAFARHFGRTSRRISRDNAIGKLIFACNGQLRRRRLSRRAILGMVLEEQAGPGGSRHLSRVLWDLFTGSAPYREVMLRTLHPGFAAGLARHAWRGLRSGRDPALVGGGLDGQHRAG
jgi:flavin-dependent dehydrogenase